MNKHILVHPYNGMLLSDNSNESQGHYAKWKKVYTQVYMFYNSIYRTMWKKQDCRERIISVDSWGVRLAIGGKFGDDGE